MSPCGPKPKCRDVRDLVAIGRKSGHNSDIAEVKRLIRRMRGRRAEPVRAGEREAALKAAWTALVVAALSR